MQVATLFRESATLLGASMETGGVGVGVSVGSATTIQDASINNPGLVLAHIDNFNHPNNNKFTLNMKLETQDDGYETSADLMLSNTTNNHNDSLKCESTEDPYSFIDEDPIMSVMPPQTPTPTHHIGPQDLTNTCSVPSMAGLASHVGLPIGPKKRGRKKKIKNNEPGMMGAASPQTPSSEYEMHHLGGHGPAMTNGTTLPKLKERKKHDRFNGMPEEEVSKRTLPDHLATNLDIIIIGINPGLFAAYKGHHYAGPGNHFWKCLYLSGLTPEQMTADEDYKLLQVGIGFTNMVQRPTKGSADLTRKEIKEGCQTLLEKLQRFKPKIAVFNGKLIYEVFSGKKDFSFGRQPDLVDGTNTYMWVMPSSSARCAQLPRAADKVPFYAALKKFRDYLNGIVTQIDDSEVVFSDSKLKSCCDADTVNKDALYSMDLMDLSNAVVKKDDTTVIPCKKKRGRPKKIKTDNDEPTPPKPTPRKQYNNQNNNSNCDFPKKKRGRPKKIKCDDIDLVIQNGERNTQTPNCFSSPSPIQSPTNFCHMSNAQMTPPNNYNNNNSIHQQSYQSPRPHSQPFTHSDLSSEISAAISSDHLGSPAPTSPSLGPPDFDPPTSMPTDDTTECRFSSPAPSTASEQPNSSSSAYPSYHTFGSMDHHSESAIHYSQTQQQQSIAEPPSSAALSLRGEFATKAQDMSSKSLSGLESLVDQIPNIAEGGETQAHAIHLAEGGDPYPGLPYPNYPQRTSPGTSPAPHTSPYSYLLNNNSNSYNVTSLSTSNNSFSVNNLTSGYGGHTSPTTSYQHNLMGNSFIDHHSCTMPQMALPPYPHQLPYGQQFSNAYPPAPPPGLHVPSPNYPTSYYNASYVQTQPNSSTPGYLHSHMFERIRPDIGYGGF